MTAVGGDYAVRLNLAASIDEGEPLRPVVAIRSDAHFSDGSPVTAADIAASFSAAKGTAAFGPLLTNITAAAAQGTDRVAFTLASPDPPVAGMPLFSGGQAGERRTRPSVPARMCITPETIPSPFVRDAAARSRASVCGISPTPMLCCMAWKTVPLPFSTVSCRAGRSPVPPAPRRMSRCLTCCFWGQRPARRLEKTEVRAALSAALSREELVSGALSGRGAPALSPFPPQWAEAADIKVLGAAENIASAVAQLEQAGYNTTDSAAGLSLELLVTQGNPFRKNTADLVAQQMARAGIAVTVTELPFAEYENRLKKGQFDLYLGEVRLSADLHLRSFLTPGGAAAYGLAAESPAAGAYNAYLAGNGTLQGFCDAFAADLPYIPLCWRQGWRLFTAACRGLSPHAYDVYSGFESWVFA